MLWYVIPWLVGFLIIIWFLTKLIIPAIIISVIILFSSVKIVTPNTIKTVETMWKFNRILRPWLNFIIPFLEWTRNQDLLKKIFKLMFKV